MPPKKSSRATLMQTAAPKFQVMVCFSLALSAHLIFFSTVRNIFRSERAHLLLRIILWSFQRQKFHSTSETFVEGK